MRVAIRVLAVWAAVTSVACTGGGEPVPVAQRFPTAAEAPGSNPDPVETPDSSATLDEFVTDFTPALIDPDPEELTKVFGDAGFRKAGLRVRFFGETHDPDNPEPHLFSWYIELGSEDGATDALDYIEADGMKPCPQSCAASVETFDVNGIPDARAVHRVATEEAIANAGFPGEVPNESYLIGFTDGSIVYTLDLNGPPGSISAEQAQSIATAFYDRITGD
jgi:hypothetical protein